jgi:3-oxoacyl-[acyl-carrier protein] reductase
MTQQRERVAVVTGGASGIGRATAELLDAQGVAVAVLDVNGGIRTDVSHPQSVDDAVTKVRETLGPISILVNAAGVAAGAPIDAPNYLDEWDRSLAVNLTGSMLMVRACVGDLVASGAGRIVNIASTEALGAGRGTGPYTVAKHGVVGLTRALAVDLGRKGVTANCVCPGATLTGMTSTIPEDDRDTFARRKIPVGRYGQPEEIAHMVVALTAVEASFVNGAVIPVDGGMTAVSR